MSSTHPGPVPKPGIYLGLRMTGLMSGLDQVTLVAVSRHPTRSCSKHNLENTRATNLWRYHKFWLAPKLPQFLTQQTVPHVGTHYKTVRQNLIQPPLLDYSFVLYA